jgi:hypothetical protein
MLPFGRTAAGDANGLRGAHNQRGAISAPITAGIQAVVAFGRAISASRQMART